MQIMHKIPAIGAAAIATALMSQPVEAQREMVELLRYSTGRQELLAQKEAVQVLACQHNSKATEMIILVDWPTLTQIDLRGCPNLTNLAILAKIGTQQSKIDRDNDNQDQRIARR